METIVKISLTTSIALGCLVAVHGSAYSAPPLDRVQVTKWKTYFDVVAGRGCLGNQCLSFTVSRHDGSSGEPWGSVEVHVEDTDAATSYMIYCAGPELSNVASLSPNGNATVSFTLDPAAQNCQFGLPDPFPILLNLTGQANGEYKATSRGNSRIEEGGMTFIANTQQAVYSTTYNGTLGFVSGPIRGSTLSDRRTDRIRTR